MSRISQLKQAAEAFLTGHLPPGALLSVDVSTQPDNFDVPSVYVLGRLRDEALEHARREQSSIMVGLQDALRDIAEERFAYLDFTSVAEEIKRRKIA